MTIGQDAKIGLNSYIALFKETTYGTFPATAETGASTLEALNIGFATEVVSQKLDQISGTRGYTKRVQLDKNVTGTLEQYLHPEESILMVADALGGGISTSSVTGAYQHVISAGNFDTSPISLSFQVRKGDTHHWQYTGGRVNNLTIAANVGELVKCSYEMVFKDSTQAGSDISSSLSISSVLPFTYVQGTYEYAATEGSLTSTVAEYINGFELAINNNLISDSGVRALGSNVLQTLAPTRREVTLTITQRFDTTTAWNRFVEATQGAARLIFEGASISAEHNYKCTLVMPKLFLNSPEPTIGAPSDILMSEITFDVLVDNPSTSTGKDIEATFVNATASY